VRNFQILIVSAVKICKLYLQATSAAGDPLNLLTGALPLQDPGL